MQIVYTFNHLAEITWRSSLCQNEMYIAYKPTIQILHDKRKPKIVGKTNQPCPCKPLYTTMISNERQPHATKNISLVLTTTPTTPAQVPPRILKPNAFRATSRLLRNPQCPLPPANLLVQDLPPLHREVVLAREPLDLIALQLHHKVSRQAPEGPTSGADESFNDGAGDVSDEVFERMLEPGGLLAISCSRESRPRVRCADGECESGTYRVIDPGHIVNLGFQILVR